MSQLIAIIAAFALIGCASAAAAASQQKGGGKTPQVSSQQTAPATGARKGTARRLTPEKIEAGSENIKR